MVRILLYVLAISSLSEHMQKLEQTDSSTGLKKYETTFAQEIPCAIQLYIQLTFGDHHLLAWFCNGVMTWCTTCPLLWRTTS